MVTNFTIETVINNEISIASTNIYKLYSNVKEQQFFSFMDNSSISLSQSRTFSRDGIVSIFKRWWCFASKSS